MSPSQERAAPPAPRHPADRIGDLVRGAERPGRFSPWVVSLLRLASPLVRLLFRPRMTGFEHLPAGPFLVVANHSGGGTAEFLSLAVCWRERFGDARPVAGMAATPVFLLPGFAGLVRSAGAIPSTYRHAEAAFAAGASVLLFPGGDHDCFRPIWKANEVDWAGRKGFLRLARRVGVPIVPLGIHGSHYTAPVLWRSRLLPLLTVLPRVLFAVKRLPITVVGVVGAALIVGLLGPRAGYAVAGALGMLWLLSPFAFVIPILPWPVTLRLGPALSVEELFGGEEGRTEEEVLEAAYVRVVGEVQRLVRARDSEGASVVGGAGKGG